MPQVRVPERAGSVVFCLLVVLSLVAAATPASGETTLRSDAGSTATVSGVGSTTFPQQTTPENNSTVVHEDPDNASGSEELEDVRRWLAGRMATAVIDCTEQVRLGSSYACERLDRDYPDWASRYVEVRGQSDAASSAGANQTLRQTRADARTLADQVQRFRELRAEYEAAREAGNDRRARELAHQLVRQSREINRTSSRVTNDYGAFSNTTSTDLSVATEAVVEIENETTETADEIREAELVGTTLTAEAVRATGSFGSPVAVEGRLVAENGSDVSDRRVAIGVGNGTVTTETDGEGRFSLEYRPTTERVGAATWTVTYLPTNASLYGQSSDRVDVEIRQERGTVTLTRSPSTVAFGDDLSVSGRVEAADRGVGEVPVVVSLDGVRVATAVTNETGHYSLDVTLPANVSAGEARVVAGLPFEGRALTAADASAAVQVESTTTRLALDGNRTAARTVQVEGRLEVPSGPVAGQAVEIAANGSTVAVVRTGPDGRFAADVDLPAAIAASDAVVVSATYASERTNLESARTQITLAPTNSTESGGLAAFVTGRLRVLFAQLTGSSGGAGGGVVEQLNSVSRAAAVALGIVGLSILGTIFVRRSEVIPWVMQVLRSGDDAPDEHQSVDERTTRQPDPEPTSDHTSDPLEIARSRLSGGDTDAAVLAGYEAVRDRLVDDHGSDSSMTHWELLRSTSLSGERAEALRQLTEAYERAAFSLETSSPETTRTALSNAASLLTDTDQSVESSDD